MTRLLKKILILLLTIVSLSMLGQQAKAQESMVQDISYLFLEKLIATARENYPLIKQNQIQEDIASLQIKSQKLNYLSPFNLIYFSAPNNGLNFANPQFFSGFQIAINLNLAQVLQNPTSVNIAKKQLDFNKQITAQFDNNLEAEVKTRYFRYIQQLNNVKLYTKSLQDSQGLLNDLRVRYERGEVTFQIYSEGLISYSTISQAKIQSEAGLLTAKATLEELTVTKLEDIR